MYVPEFVRARLDIRPFQFTSTMTSRTTVTATDTVNDAVKYALERVGKAGMVLLVRNITATQAVLSAPHSCNIAYEQRSAKISHDSCTDGR